MGIFDRFPYSSTHEMNLDFMLGKATEIAEDMQTVTAGMSQVQAGLSAISEKTEQATQAAAQAAQSASSIEGSVTAAEEAAEEAQMHNESAQTWANNALTYKADCQRAATEAAASSSSAAQAATAAAASEDTVAQYAQAANASAQSAANNNDSAHQYANQASASASNATFHSSNAQTAATNANTSATNASASADRAASLKTDVETLHRMCVAAADQASTEAVNAANSAAQAAAAKTDVENLVESLPEDFTDLNNTVNQLSNEIADNRSRLTDIDGNVGEKNWDAFCEVGNIYISNGAIAYGSATNKIRTKIGFSIDAHIGDTFVMKSDSYKYIVIYPDADGVLQYSGWKGGKIPWVVPNNCQCYFSVQKTSDDTIASGEVSEIMELFTITRSNTLASRLETAEMSIDENNVIADRLANVDGQVLIPGMELGAVECIAETGFVYTDNAKRIRVRKGRLIALQKGDVITCSDWSRAWFFGGYQKTDGTYVQIVTQSADYEMTEDGDFTFSARYADDREITEVDALAQMFSIVRPVPSDSQKETLPHNDMYYTGNVLRRVYNPYHDGGSMLLNGQLHCHTRYNDNGTIKYYNDGNDATAFASYRQAGYDFMTTTNYGSLGEVHHPDTGSLPDGLVWLFDSQEAAIDGVVNTIFPPKHSCVYNYTTAIPTQTKRHWQKWADEMKPLGAMVTIAHPFWTSTYQSTDDLDRIVGHIRFVEVYNGEIIHRYTVKTPTGKGTDYAFETMLDKGLAVWGLGVNDAHTTTNQEHIKDGCVKVFADAKNRESILKNLCNGNFVACSNIDVSISGVSFADGIFTVSTGNTEASTVFLKEGGTVLATIVGSSASYTLNGTEKYVRAIVTFPNGEKIWTQPIINLFDCDYDDYLNLASRK